jgi:hypothetical protein
MGKKIPVTIGHLSFEYRDAAFEYFQKILTSQPAFEPLMGQARKDVEALLCNHENAETKIGTGIAELFVGTEQDHSTRCFGIYRTNGTLDNFSYIKAVKGKTMPRMRFMQAGRAAVEEDIQAFKAKQFSEQAYADNMITFPGSDQRYGFRDIHVDHVEPSFRAIADAFLAQENLDPATVEYDTTGIIGTRFHDQAMAARFRAFHNERATLKLTPASDNLKKAWLARADRAELRPPSV